MNRLELNLAKRPFTNDTLAWVLVGALGVAGLGLTVWNVSLFVSVRGQVADLEDRREALHARQRDADRAMQGLLREGQRTLQELGASRATFANQIIQQWAFSWTDLFSGIEGVIPYGVRLRAIRPRFDDGLRVRLGGIARDNESFWDFQIRLQRSRSFGDVYPEAVQASDARMTLGRGEQLFSLEMEYYPGMGAEVTADEAVEPVGAQVATETVATPGAVDGVVPLEAGTAPGDAIPGTTTAGGPGTTTAADTGGATSAGAAAPGDAQGSPTEADAPAAGRARRNARPTRQSAGIQRATPLPQGTPLVAPPVVGTGRRPELDVSPDLSGYTKLEDGTFVDEDGNVATLDQLLGQRGHIRPQKGAGLPSSTNPEDPDAPTPGAGEDLSDNEPPDPGADQDEDDGSDR